MDLRRRWLALAIAFLWGAFGALHPDALRRPASADADIAPPWAILAPRRAVVDRASIASDPSAPATDAVGFALALPGRVPSLRAPERTAGFGEPSSACRSIPRSRGPPPAISA